MAPLPHLPGLLANSDCHLLPSKANPCAHGSRTTPAGLRWRDEAHRGPIRAPMHPGVTPPWDDGDVSLMRPGRFSPAKPPTDTDASANVERLSIESALILAAGPPDPKLLLQVEAAVSYKQGLDAAVDRLTELVAGIPRYRRLRRDRNYSAALAAIDAAYAEVWREAEADGGYVDGQDVLDAMNLLDGTMDTLSVALVRLTAAVAKVVDLQQMANAIIDSCAIDAPTNTETPDDRGPGQLIAASPHMTTGPPAVTSVLPSADTAGARAA